MRGNKDTNNLEKYYCNNMRNNQNAQKNENKNNLEISKIDNDNNINDDIFFINEINLNNNKKSNLISSNEININNDNKQSNSYEENNIANLLYNSNDKQKKINI